VYTSDHHSDHHFEIHFSAPHLQAAQLLLASISKPLILANGNLDGHCHATTTTAFALGPARSAARAATHITIRPLGAEAGLDTRPTTTGARPVRGFQAVLLKQLLLIEVPSSYDQG
jgi:hypothetical protein